MTRAELVAAVADRSGLNRAQAKAAVDAMIQSMCAALKAGDEVRLVGFGSFTPVKKPAGLARNPRTGETVQRAAAVTCKFRPGDALKALLNG